MVTSSSINGTNVGYIKTIPERFALSLLRPFRVIFSKKAQVSGLDNLRNEDGNPLPGPFIWSVKHESRWDVSTLAHLWYKLPQSPCKMKAAVRFDPFKEHPNWQFLDGPLMWVFQKLAISLHRTDKLNGLSPGEKDRLQNMNRKALENLVKDFTLGVHGAFAPEGTSKSNGDLTQNQIKAGVYYLTRSAFENGLSVPCAPVGVTYDFMSGPKGIWGKRQGWGQPRQIVCARFGAPIKYEPLDKEGYSSIESWRKNDKEAFLARIKYAFIDLNTITLSQIAGEYIRRRAEKMPAVNAVGGPSISLELLAKVATDAVYNLRGIEKVRFENGLVDSSFEARVRQFYASLQKEEYVGRAKSGEVEINQRRVLHEPETDATYKHENILLYSTNRIRSIASVSPEIGEALNRTFREVA